ncbi:DNA repair radA domain protein [Wolbachia endosymbiont of Brugia pahangi]|nr:DNA repair radA domain protein [Wolbachia endosymbiont of Brugia pahangi]
MYDSKITSALGTVNQVRTCVHELTVLVKQYGIYFSWPYNQGQTNSRTKNFGTYGGYSTIF